MKQNKLIIISFSIFFYTLEINNENKYTKIKNKIK